ncbi:hypothetical protein D9M72_554260 [compost metagenome]
MRNAVPSSRLKACQAKNSPTAVRMPPQSALVLSKESDFIVSPFGYRSRSSSGKSRNQNPNCLLSAARRCLEGALRTSNVEGHRMNAVSSEPDAMPEAAKAATIEARRPKDRGGQRS